MTRAPAATGESIHEASTPFGRCKKRVPPCILRDWRSLALSLAIPVILILLFGYALTLDLRKVPTVVWDQSRSPQSRESIESVFRITLIFPSRGTMTPMGGCNRPWTAEPP